MAPKKPRLPDTDASADKGAPTDRVDTTGAQTSEQAPMGAHPTEAPRLTKALTDSYRDVQPPGFRAIRSRRWKPPTSTSRTRSGGSDCYR